MQLVKLGGVMAASVIGLLTVLTIATFFLIGPAAVDNSGNTVESIEFQNRQGNVASTEPYIVKLENGSEFRYSRAVPGPGMLCDTENPGGSCETRIEPGYREVSAAVSGLGFVEKEGSPVYRKYTPSVEKCVSDLSSEDIEIQSCQ